MIVHVRFIAHRAIESLLRLRSRPVWSNGNSAMPPRCANARRGGSPQLEDQVRESVDHARLPVEPRRRVHHAEHANPIRDAIEVAERTLEAAEDREPVRRAAV
jgi:hypothetical protein